MTSRIQITLSRDEMRALSQISQQELRDPREQLRFLLRQHLAERGMLPTANEPQAVVAVTAQEPAQ